MGIVEFVGIIFIISLVIALNYQRRKCIFYKKVLNDIDKMHKADVIIDTNEVRIWRTLHINHDTEVGYSNKILRFHIQ